MSSALSVAVRWNAQLKSYLAFRCLSVTKICCVSFCSNVAQDVTSCQYLGGIVIIYFIISFMYLFYGDRVICVAGAFCPDIMVRSWPLFLH